MKSQKHTKWKAEYQDAANVKIEKIVTLIYVTVDDEEDNQENDVPDNNWNKWARKTDTRRKYASSMFIDIVLSVESQYIKTSKQIWWIKFEKFWKLISNQKLLWVLKQRRLLLISERFWN